ncbi:AMP-binding protein [Thermomicrobiaceae bacterium CFH 74404]|uniref:AMP-binding protein n=1 Tax=Thermalbibacter longus TaxID=2951981 RepID=A0AA41WCA0_9BACT|nr:AMP-binding protein [Thermalbibacter longus]MCM8750514.1 AMP-binding protein [Thermalbibacter longus]
MHLRERSLNEVLLSRLQQGAEEPLLTWHERVITVSEAVANVASLAQYLRKEIGVAPGSRVAVLALNRPETLLLLFAAAHIGGIVVLLNTRYSPAEVAAVLEDASPCALFYDTATQALAEAGAAQLRSSFHMVPVDDLALQPALSVQEAAQELQHPAGDLATPVLMLYTSGTTGALKGVPLTQGNLLANVGQIGAAITPPAKAEALVVTPLFHAALIPSALVPLSHGLPLVVCERFSPAEAIELLATRSIAWTVMVPTMIQACLDLLGGDRLPSGDHPRFIYYGASPAPRALIEEAMRGLGAQLIQSYGLTEATQAVTVLSPHDHRVGLADAPHLLRSAGRPLPATELAVWSGDGTPLPSGQVGEIVVRGPQVMGGYWNRPAETAQVLVNGWLRTGDAGFLDEHGYLYVTDRIKDVIISGGENVFSPRVEDVVRSHAAVREVAVVGLRHAVWGETVHAVVVLRPGFTETPELAADIIQHCRNHLAGFEIPRSIEFASELPKSATGKILKRLLRERAPETIAIACDLRVPSGPADRRERR